MATEEVIVSRRDDVMRPKVSWSALFAGTVLALALWALLAVFGLAAGLTALDPADPQAARAVGIGTGIWSVIAPLLALFVGGFVAANLANVRGKGSGAMHGAVLWGLCTVLSLVVLGATVGTVVTGTARMGAEVAQAGPWLADMLDITARDAVEPLNERLREEGKPTVTAAQLRATAQDAANTAIREGELDREVLMGALVRNTALDRQDAEELAATLEARIQEVGITQTALRAGERLGLALWWPFLAMLLGLLSGVLGGVLGARKVTGETTERRRIEHRPTVEEGPARPTTTAKPGTPSPSEA
jgi:hypothetical protein